MLRGLAASMVVASHSNTMMGHAEFFGGSPFPLRYTGGFGVNIFFVISGFIIAYVTLSKDGAPRIPIRDYARRRWVRIVPFMWLCIIGYNLLSWLGTRQIDWMPMLRAFVLWPTGELKPNVLWSLRHELIFYVLFAVALMMPVRRLWILVLWFVAPLVYGSALYLTGGAIRPSDPQWAEFLHVLLSGSDFGANLQFGAGFLLGVMRLRGAGWLAERRRWPMESALLLAIVLAAGVEWLALPQGLARSIVWTLLPAAIVLLALVATGGSVFLVRIGKILGDASFSIYLVHNPALLILFHGVLALGTPLPLPMLYFAFVTAAILAGVAVHYLVEAPFIRLLTGTFRPVAPWQRRARAG